MSTAGYEITTANDDASIAKANRKQILIADGLTIENTVPEGLGQLACCTDTLANGRREQSHYYCAVQVGANDPKAWGRLTDNIMFPINWGSFVPCSATYANNVDGILKIASTSGTLSLQSMDASHGRPIEFLTGSGIGNTAGINLGQHFTQRQFDPAIHFKIRLRESSSNRFYLGFTGTTLLLSGDDPLNGANGIVLGKRSTDTNWQVLRNDGSGATNATNTTLGVGTGKVIMHIYAFDGMGGFSTFIETDSGEEGQNFTTDVPSTTQDENFQATLITTGSFSRAVDIFQGFISSQR